MARPKRSEQKSPIDMQLKKALFDCIIEKGFAETRVSDITEIVGCNRGTFYYYFKDLYELRDAVIDDNLPRELPGMIFSIFLNRNGIEEENYPEINLDLHSCIKNNSDLFGSLMHDGIVANSEKIDATALLLNSDIGDAVSKRIETQALEIWSSLLGFKNDELNIQIRVILEFLIGGLLNILAFRAQSGFKDDFLETVRSLMPEIPVAIVACLEKSMSDASGPVANSINALVKTDETEKPYRQGRHSEDGLALI